MYDKYEKLMREMIDTNGGIDYKKMLELFGTDNNYYKYERPDLEYPTAIEQEFHYVEITINGFDELIVEKNITKSIKKPNNKKVGFHCTAYSENEITTEEIDEQIELLYQDYIKDIKIQEKTLKNKIDSKNKIFKKHLRLKKINRIIED